MGRFPAICGAVAEWSKALAWKVSIRQKRIVGSNPTRSAISLRSRYSIGSPFGTGAIGDRHSMEARSRPDARTLSPEAVERPDPDQP